MAMEQWVLGAPSLRSDAVAYTTGAPAALVQPENSYILVVGDNISKYRQVEIWDVAEWLLTEATAAMETARFPRPANGLGVGGTFFRATLIQTAFGLKWQKTLVTSTALATDHLTNQDSVYWGYTAPTAAAAINTAVQMGSKGMDAAFMEIKQYYLGSAQASA